MIGEVKGLRPKIPASCWIAEDACVIGDVSLGEHVSFWPGAVARGDVHWIKIGDYTNVQDGCILHVTNGKYPLSIGSRVTIGHKVLLHGCTVGDDCLVGMGAIVLDGVEIGAGSVIAAGALLPPGKKYPAGHLIMGTPAKAVRPLSVEERKDLIEVGWKNYAEYKEDYRKSFKRLQN